MLAGTWIFCFLYFRFTPPTQDDLDLLLLSVFFLTDSLKKNVKPFPPFGERICWFTQFSMRIFSSSKSKDAGGKNWKVYRDTQWAALNM